MDDFKQKQPLENALLYPADMYVILDKYGHLLKSYPNLREKESVFANYRRTIKRLEVLLPLKEHPVHGITGLHVVENYDEAGYIRRYQYNWKIIIPRLGVKLHHISAWGNEPHDAEWTPNEYCIETEPHHHHYDPEDRRKRKENYNVRTLDQAFQYHII